MSKPKAPAAPNYTPIAQADQAQAQMEYNLGEQQLQQTQSEYNNLAPYALDYLKQQTASSAAQTAQATENQNFFNTTFKPIETQFANQATSYNTPARANANAGAAEADVASSFDANRQASLQNLESYGIDPSQTRYGALDLSTRIAQSAATAAAGTQSRLNTEATGLGLEGQAINVGQGIGASALNNYTGATTSGASGINTMNSTNATGASTNAMSNSFTNAGVNASSAGVGALNTGYQNNLAGANFNYGVTSNASAGAGSLIGGALGLASMFI